MFKEIYNPTQKKCNVPQSLGYDTKSLCSEHNSTKESIDRSFDSWQSKFHCFANNKYFSVKKPFGR